jgi:hypothetical protein
MRFETLLALIKRGQVTRDSIVRGPTTHQFWKRAAEVKGVSREFGLCYSCGGEIDARAEVCPHCNRLQEPPANPDSLIETRETAAGNGEARPRSNRGTLPAAPVPQPRAARDSSERADLAAPRSQPIVEAPQSLSDEQTKIGRQITSRPPASNRKQGRARESAPTGDRPVAIRPRTPGADDALLTPQELATAFQLDFAPDKPRRRRGAKVLVMLLVLVLLGGAVAALAYLRPDLRKASIAWGQRTYSQAKVFIASRTQSAAPVTPPAVGAHSASARAGQHAAHGSGGKASSSPKQPPAVASSGRPHEKPSEPVAQTMPPVDVVVTPTIPAGPSKPEKSTNDAAEASAHLAPPVANPPAPAAKPSEPVVDSNAPPAPAAEASDAQQPNAPASAADSDPYAQAKRLWIQAIDAEATQDYAGAVKCYEQIKKLPPDVHPWGLDERLDWARKQIK